MENEMVTTDLSKFGYRELDLAGDLLKAYAENGSPDGFSGDNLKLTMSFNSGNVFLADDDGDVLMMNGDKLEKWFVCSECRNEGFAEDVTNKAGQCNNCGEKDSLY